MAINILDYSKFILLSEHSGQATKRSTDESVRRVVSVRACMPPAPSSRDWKISHKGKQQALLPNST